MFPQGAELTTVIVAGLKLNFCAITPSSPGINILEFNIPNFLFTLGFILVASSPTVSTKILVESVNPLVSDILILKSPLVLDLPVKAFPSTITFTS